MNKSSKQILDNLMDKPMFMFRKFRVLSEENQNDWIQVNKSMKNS